MGDKIMSATFQREPDVKLGLPKVLFEWSNMGGRDFLYGHDSVPDGERFLMLDGSKPRTITVVLNWFEELSAKFKNKGNFWGSILYPNTPHHSRHVAQTDPAACL